MFLRVGELISHNKLDNILALPKIYDGSGTRGQKQRSKINLKVSFMRKNNTLSSCIQVYSDMFRIRASG